VEAGPVITTPTTTVSILGGAPTESEWGDPVESETVIRSGVPAAIHQQRRVIIPEGQTTPMSVRYWTGYLPAGTEINDQQRVRDERTGRTYTIDSVEQPAHPAMPQDVQLDLRSVD
jgi:hypothetical protein